MEDEIRSLLSAETNPLARKYLYACLLELEARKMDAIAAYEESAGYLTEAAADRAKAAMAHATYGAVWAEVERAINHAQNGKANHGS